MGGFRFGEATNPGPGLDSVTFAAINPTTILHKVPELLELGAHVVVASETAANRAVQSTVTRQLRQHKFRCHWGPPVPDRVNADTGRVGMRGAALGTAIFQPCLADPLLKTCPTSCPAVVVFPSLSSVSPILKCGLSHFTVFRNAFLMLPLRIIFCCPGHISVPLGREYRPWWQATSMHLCRVFLYGPLSSSWAGLSCMTSCYRRSNFAFLPHAGRPPTTTLF